ncbi:WD40/YVTN/BNR-like repeat-containing protein [Dactylosporangium matsuzakiense]|uniref:Oxidoreductase n=1 Tax=Dactylosporangium matsuzakiense TaxID=53360 RepID=A0A9W6KN33_9ACTN|nr:oxidoreductase [Dactylosporangium matsuzakiense]UWZ41583.1 oxidoreductase [Dactylosporangium matsuzakiense]GLL02349.1 oxidoreductase [Dactylosporangium matsuzakiense]
MRRVVALVLGLAVVAAVSGFGRPGPPSWRLLDSGSTAQFRGLSAVSDRIAWVSGTGGTVLRTVDGGRTWRSVGPPDTAALQFRDIEAFDAFHAVILSIGNGEDSRVYRTDDGGRTWAETFRNTDPAAFYDCMAFADARHGLALGDPVDGHFQLLATDDGGRHWDVQSVAVPALDDEFAFAASGTCLAATGRDAWFATGGAARARVFHSGDLGRHWSVVDSPVPSGPTAGIYSLAFRDARHGLAVGGDYNAPATAPNGAALTRDGGRTWTAARTVPGEYRSGVAWAPSFALAVGPTGSDVSRDGGRTWTRFDTGSFDAVACAGAACWASGEKGRIARLS